MPAASLTSTLKSKAPQRIQAACIGFLALLFLFSALDKLFHYSGFLNALRNYVILPQGVAPLLALPVIFTEVAVAIGLLVESLRRTSALIGAVMMATFIVALAANLLYGSKGVCGCWFSFTLAQGNTSHIASNFLLLGLFLTIALGYTPNFSSLTEKE